LAVKRRIIDADVRIRELEEQLAARDAQSVRDAALKRIVRELRAYHPAADTHEGKHIHKVWAREIEAASAPPQKPSEESHGNT
jgi:hypothetical protein